MHLINLKLSCKEAIGDGTEIVCMNNDYVVRITAEDCGTFTDSPIKKLIVKQGREYYEVDIVRTGTPSNYKLEAKLPPLEHNHYVELGVCGKASDGITINYASTAAKFKCVKSALNGVVIPKGDPKLEALKVTENGTYKAVDKQIDGFYEVDVDIEMKREEARTVTLNMQSGHQKILPTSEKCVMTSVTVHKPAALCPENIRNGIHIAGITGSLEYHSMEKVISADGEYTPSQGYEGFSKVIVDVGKSRIDKVLNFADNDNPSFEHPYTNKVAYELSKSGIVACLDTGDAIQVTAQNVGDCVVTIYDLDADNNIVNTTYYTVYVINNSTTPVGTFRIKNNGEYKISNYMYVDVQVTKPSAYIEGNVLYIRNLQ